MQCKVAELAHSGLSDVGDLHPLIYHFFPVKLVEIGHQFLFFIAGIMVYGSESHCITIGFKKCVCVCVHILYIYTYIRRIILK